MMTKLSFANTRCFGRTPDSSLTFPRPSDDVRAEIIKTSVPELSLKQAQVAELVQLTGAQEAKNRGVPFTSSDITDRLLPAALSVSLTRRPPRRNRRFHQLEPNLASEGFTELDWNRVPQLSCCLAP